jgi:hypothetical protein
MKIPNVFSTKQFDESHRKFPPQHKENPPSHTTADEKPISSTTTFANFMKIFRHVLMSLSEISPGGSTEHRYCVYQNENILTTCSAFIAFRPFDS